jgi:hypothetical protein
MIMILAVADHYRVIPSVMAVPSAQCRYRKWVTKHILDTIQPFTMSRAYLPIGLPSPSGNWLDTDFSGDDPR